MPRCYCPVCMAEYDENPKVCTCGFEGIEYPRWNTEEEKRAFFQKQLFALYKFTKHVYYNRLEYPKSELLFSDFEGRTIIDSVCERKGLAIVDMVAGRDGCLSTLANEGLLALKRDTQALILNVDEAASTLLDEASVHILFLGADFGGFEDDCLVQSSPLRYIFVDDGNKHFVADDQVLFNKNKTRLVVYASLRPGEEYTVPASVKVISAHAFLFSKHLKRLYLPKGIRLERHALDFIDGQAPEVVYY